MKNILHFLMLVLITFSACKKSETNQATAHQYIKVEGKTMGTTYHITYSDSLQRNLKENIENLLNAINNDCSTYIPNSYVSQFNQAKKEFELTADTKNQHPHFWINFNKAKAVYELSKGGFDITVMPIVNYWGFGYSGNKPVTKIDSNEIKKLLPLIGFNKMTQELKGGKTYLVKGVEGMQLDFNAIAQGYAVDAIAAQLAEQGISNYFVEVGGETLAKGKNPQGEDWVVGINTPKEGSATDEFVEKVKLHDKALATSGNYRRTYMVGNQRIVHTINPTTGFPEINNLLSVTILAPDCITADSYATACMVMGLEKAKTWIQQQNGIDALFIFSEADGKMATWNTEGFNKMKL